MLALILALLDEEENDRFNILYKNTHKVALKVAGAILKNDYDAEEAVQEAFLRVALHIHKVDDPFSRRALNYVMKITKHRALDKLKKRKRGAAAPLDEKTESILTPICSAESYWLDEVQYQRLVTCVRRLEEPYEIVLYFYLVERMKVVEIAKLLEKKPNTIEQQIIRGKRILRAMIAKEILRDD